MKVIFILFIALSTGHGYSDSYSNKSSRQASKAKTEIDFENRVIEGRKQNPFLGVVEGNSGFDDNSVIELREDFLDEAAKDGGEPLR